MCDHMCSNCAASGDAGNADTMYVDDESRCSKDTDGGYTGSL